MIHDKFISYFRAAKTNIEISKKPAVFVTEVLAVKYLHQDGNDPDHVIAGILEVDPVVVAAVEVAKRYYISWPLIDVFRIYKIMKESA